MTELILVRHGETAWNAQRRIQGNLDAPLNDVGQAQAQAVGDRFRDTDIDVLVSSDLTRAMQTVAPIANHCGLEVMTDERLRERKLGILEGFFYAEAKEKMPEILDIFLGRKVHTPIEDGESLREFSGRVIEVLTELVTAHGGKRIVAMTHGGVIDIAYRHATGDPLEKPRDFAIHNTSVSTFRVDGSDLELVDFADLSHLPERLALDDL